MPKLQYKIGDQVTCIYKETAYESRVQNIKNIDGPKPVYVVHFIGWNSRYDEDVPYDQANGKLFPGSAADYVAKNGGKLDDRYRKQTTEEKQQLQADSNTPSTSAKKPRKSAFQGTNKAKDLTLELPKQLRKVLVDDLAMINQNFYLRLPAEKTISEIVEEYIKTIPITTKDRGNLDDLFIEYEDKTTKVTNVALICTAEGIRDYFNVVHEYQLLYKFERPQWNDLRQAEAKRLKCDIKDLRDNGFRPANFYGIVHLLRMLARMPDLLKLTQWNDHLINRIQAGMHDFLVYLNKNIDAYYHEGGDYEAADTDYFRRVSTIEDAASAAQ